VLQFTTGLSLSRPSIFASSPRLIVSTIARIWRAICFWARSSFSHSPTTWQWPQETPRERA
jgi:hypothetical protein